LSLSTLVLAAAEGDGGLTLLPPPTINSTSDAGAAAAWLASGDWLLPQALYLPSDYGNGKHLTINNVTMVVAPQSLALVQQALTLVNANSTSAIASKISQVCNTAESSSVKHACTSSLPATVCLRFVLHRHCSSL
jgi:hypothetical protein